MTREKFLNKIVNEIEEVVIDKYTDCLFVTVNRNNCSREVHIVFLDEQALFFILVNDEVEIFGELDDELYSTLFRFLDSGVIILWHMIFITYIEKRFWNTVHLVKAVY